MRNFVCSGPSICNGMSGRSFPRKLSSSGPEVDPHAAHDVTTLRGGEEVGHLRDGDHAVLTERARLLDLEEDRARFLDRERVEVEGSDPAGVAALGGLARVLFLRRIGHRQPLVVSP